MAAGDARCDLEANVQRCTCAYQPYPRKGKCCECIAYDRAKSEIRGRLFPPEAERAYEPASCSSFLTLWHRQGCQSVAVRVVVDRNGRAS